MVHGEKTFVGRCFSHCWLYSFFIFEMNNNSR